MTTERIDIVVREDGSRVVKRNLADIGDEAEGVADSLDLLKTALLGVAAAFSFQKFAQITGVWTDLNARVARFTGTAKGTEVVMGRLMSIAQRTYAPLEGIADIYLENAFALKELGKSTEETLDYTEALTNALVVSGAKGDRQASVISAMSKAMLEGKLAGDNWNTVLTTGGRVVEALVQETGKSLEELKAMAKAGDLKGDTVFTALISQLDTLREEADDMPATIGDAFIRMQNRILEVVGKLDAELGTSAGVVAFIDMVTKNLEQIIPILAAVGAAIVTAFAPMVIMRFAAALKTLWALMLANPFVVVAAAIAGVITYLYIMRDSIKLGIDETTTLGDLMRAVWESVGGIISEVADVVKTVWSAISDTVADVLNNVSDNTEASTKDQEAWWLKLVRMVAKVFDAIGATIRATMLAIGRTIGTVIGIAVEQFRDLGRVATAALSGNFDEAANAAASFATRAKSVIGEVGAVWGNTFREEFEAQSTGGLEAWLDGRLARAQEIGRDRSKEEAFKGLPGGSGGGGGGVDPVDKNAVKKAKELADALNALLNRINPIRAAQQELAEAEKILNDAQRAGLITMRERNSAYDTLKEQLREQLEPYEFMLEAMREEAELSKMLGRERAVEADLKARVNQLTAAGVDVTKQMTDELRAQIVVQQQLNAISQEKDYLIEGSNARLLESFEVTAKAMKQLVDDATSGFTSGDIATMVVDTFGSIVDGTSMAVEANLAQWTMMYEQIDILRQQDLISEEQASEIRRAIKAQEMDMYLQRTSDALGAAAGLMKANNKEAFKMGQAAAIAQTMMNTYAAATAAYKSAANIPYVGWILGPVAAAGAVAAGMAQVSAIRSQQPPAYRTGGTYTVGGHGGVDSQTVALRASPGEQISINTPAQANAMHNIEQLLREDRGARGGSVTQNVTIVQQGKPDRSTAAQQARALRKEARLEYERNG